MNRNLKDIRPPAVADMFYPADDKKLKKMILEYLDEAPFTQIEGKLKAIIAPHAGYVYSGPVAAYAYKLLEKLDQSVQWKILLLGPSHRVFLNGAAVTAFKKWNTPFGNVEVRDIRDEIGDNELIVDLPGADREEHSLEVQVPFLQMVLKNFVIYPLMLGDLNTKVLAEYLTEFCKRDDVIVVASSDLSHYLEYSEAKGIDLETCKSIEKIDIEGMQDRGDACGKMGILTLLHLARELNWKCKLLDYRNSGDTAGTKDQVVGYGSFAFFN